jgi:4-amino-4-deoxy-L-arabinose transferase-like glycosyltransferase
VRALLVSGGLALVALFVGLESVGFLDEREARDAAVAHELLVRRELLTPVLGGEAHFEKPLLAYGTEVLGAALTPDSPLGPRALKAVLAAALVAATGWLGARLLGRRAGACAAAVLATSLAIPLAARTDGTQVLASLLGWLGLSGLVLSLLAGPRPGALLFAYAALAAAAVIAGPLAALWPIAAVGLHAALERDAGWWRRLQTPAGAGLVLGAALPWYGAMVERHGTEFASRLLSMPYGLPGRDPWYAGPARSLGFLVVGFFPWSTLLPAAGLQAIRAWRVGPAAATVPPGRRARLLLAALAAGMLPSLVAPSAPLPAVLPALPAAALLVGGALDRLFAADPLPLRMTVHGAHLLGVAGSVAAVLLAWASARLVEASPAIRLVAAYLLLVAWGPALAAFAGRPRAAPALFGLVVALGTPLVALRALPLLDGFLTTGQVVAAMEGVAARDAPLVLLEPARPSLRRSLRHNLVVATDLRGALREQRASDGYSYVAFPPRREGTVARAASPTPLEILVRTPALVLARVGPEAPEPIQNKLP